MFLAACLLAIVTAAAFANSFGGPFVFDDDPSIVQNRTIRQLWPIWGVLSPFDHGGDTVSGRPLLNLSFAINYAISGYGVRSYHAANLAIHVLAALTLFGVVRRTLLLPSMRDDWAKASTPLALAVALLWAIHPLQTESVTYIVQRAESLVGLFFLLTLYCFIRGATGKATPWYWATALACLLGMACKEVMASAPLIVLLYDRTFVGGTFREAWRRRYGLYLALAGTWLLLAWLVACTGGRGGTVGFDAGAGSWNYLCTQFVAICQYLKLCVWPRSLLFDYGDGFAQDASQIASSAALLALLGVLTIVALWRWPKAGFLGAWFFVILAPTSSVIPVATQTAAEHRMYLPLAAVAMAAVFGGYMVGRWFVRRGTVSLRVSLAAGGLLTLLAVSTLGVLTFRRNADYRSAVSIWRDTAAKARGSVRAHCNLGSALFYEGRIDEAILEIERALKIDPNYAEAHTNLGAALSRKGRMDEAVAHFRRAVEIRPDYTEAYNNLGAALNKVGRTEEAIIHFNKALQIKPDYAESHNNLGVALAGRGQVDAAVAHFYRALELKPDYAEAHSNLGAALAGRGRIDEAIDHYRKALELNPDYAEAHNNLGAALVGRGQLDEAIDHFEKALAAIPNYSEASKNLDAALAQRKKVNQADVPRRESK